METATILHILEININPKLCQDHLSIKGHTCGDIPAQRKLLKQGLLVIFGHFSILDLLNDDLDLGQGHLNLSWI